ncbi:hypothetical protein K9L97_00220 [Candidatus Woesearchaeota archaeon]|nr:hypothetical protein [Candidatus Woesearchaeota archaeon]
MNKTILANLKDVKKSLEQHVRNTGNNIAIIAGHHPINEYGVGAFNPCEMGSFGIFSKKTLEIGAHLVHFAKDLNKEAKIIYLVDDFSRMSDKNWYMKSDDESKKTKNVVLKSIEFGLATGDFLSALNEFNLTPDNLLASGSDCFFLESKYREHFAKKYLLDPGCAGEYKMILDEIASKNFNMLIGLLPIRCQGPTCNAVGKFYTSKKNRMNIVSVYFPSEEHIQDEDSFVEFAKDKYGGFIKLLRA